MPWYAILIIAVLAMSSGTVLASIDRPRKPITPNLALATLVANGLMIWGVVALAT